MSATPVTQPSAAVRIPRELWVLVAAAFVIALGFGLILPVLPQFAQSFGVGATASSIVVSAFAFFRLLFAPAGGRLIAKFGERPIYLAGLVIVAISTAPPPSRTPTGSCCSTGAWAASGRSCSPCRRSR